MLFCTKTPEIDYAVKILVVFLFSIINHLGRNNFVAEYIADVREVFEKILTVRHRRFYLVCIEASVRHFFQNVHLVLLLVAVKIQLWLLSTVEFLFD